jgi:hypothetical protein
MAWEDRYEDWKLSRNGGCKKFTGILELDVDRTACLPCLYNMGDAWYAASFDIVEKSLGVIGDAWVWETCWSGFRVFDDHYWDHSAKVRVRHESGKEGKKNGKDAIIVEKCDCRVCTEVVEAKTYYKLD